MSHQTLPFAAPPIQPGRRPLGMSAILLPFASDGSVDWHGFERHVERTLAAGLVPAVNMDTGYLPLIDDATRCNVLNRTDAIAAGRMFVAGAFAVDAPGDAFQSDQYSRRIHEIQVAGGTPVIFQSFGLTMQSDDGIIAAYEQLAVECDQFIGFELGQMFAPFGAIYSQTVYRGLLAIPACMGAKHSSLDRITEWNRLALRDSVRPDFRVLTGNDLAIDMIMYGSDYLLGLSTFAPDLFAQRDALWAAGDARFYPLNDVLQYLGCFAFRRPVPAYKHSAAMFLHLRGWIRTSLTHPASPLRPDSDVAVLREILDGLSAFLD